MNDGMIEAGQSDALVNDLTRSIERDVFGDQVAGVTPVIFLLCRTIVTRLRAAGMVDSQIREILVR